MCARIFGTFIKVKKVDCGQIRMVIYKEKIVLVMGNTFSGCCFDKGFKRECESVFVFAPKVGYSRCCLCRHML